MGASALALWTQHLTLRQQIDPLYVRTWPQRLATAGDAIWFYLGKLAWPHPLMAVYPRWSPDARSASAFLALAAVVAMLGVLFWKRQSWGRPWFFVFAYFVVALTPALGLIDGTIFHHSIVFDHFQYLASMGPLALLGAGWTLFLRSGGTRAKAHLPRCDRRAASGAGFDDLSARVGL